MQDIGRVRKHFCCQPTLIRTITITQKRGNLLVSAKTRELGTIGLPDANADHAMEATPSERCPGLERLTEWRIASDARDTGAARS